jgi:hypothetical protein
MASVKPPAGGRLTPMADKDPGDEPSLELPKLFSRKKAKRRRSDDEDPAVISEESTVQPAADDLDARTPGPPADAPVEPMSAPPEERAGSTPAEPPVEPAGVPSAGAPSAERPAAVEPDPEERADAEPTLAAGPALDEAGDGATEVTAELSLPAPAPDTEPEPVDAPEAVGAVNVQSPEQVPSPPLSPAVTTPIDPVDDAAPDDDSDGYPDEDSDETEPAGRRRGPKAPTLPTMSTGAAAALVGALVGVLGIGLTWLGLLGCAAIRGTQSCGGPGLLVMFAIMVALVVAGSHLLKALGVPQSGSLSFLGFGILAVVVLTFLAENLYNPWVLVSLPVISAAGYGIAHWVTTRFTEPDPDFTH